MPWLMGCCRVSLKIHWINSLLPFFGYWNAKGARWNSLNSLVTSNCCPFFVFVYFFCIFLDFIADLVVSFCALPLVFVGAAVFCLFYYAVRLLLAWYIFFFFLAFKLCECISFSFATCACFRFVVGFCCFMAWPFGGIAVPMRRCPGVAERGRGGAARADFQWGRGCVSCKHFRRYFQMFWQLHSNFITSHSHFT